MRQRIRQFRDASRPPSSADLTFADAHLPAALLALFRAQHPRDIVHSAATARWLIERRHNDSDLLAAALLHDIAKGDQRRADRVLYVLLAPFDPLPRIVGSQSSALAWRSAIWRSHTHSERGATMLAEAGATPRTVELALLHHTKGRGDGMLALLQEADAAN